MGDPPIVSPKGHHPGLEKPWKTPRQEESREEQWWGRSGWEGLENLDLDVGDLGSGHASSWEEPLQRQLLLLSRAIWDSQESLTEQEEPHPGRPGWDQREFHGRERNNSGTKPVMKRGSVPRDSLEQEFPINQGMVLYKDRRQGNKGRKQM